MKSLFIAICSIFLFTACSDKVVYVDIHGNCKYIEINGELMMCSEMENKNEYEKIYVAPCLEVINENEIKVNTDKCR